MSSGYLVTNYDTSACCTLTDEQVEMIRTSLVTAIVGKKIDGDKGRDILKKLEGVVRNKRAEK